MSKRLRRALRPLSRRRVRARWCRIKVPLMKPPRTSAFCRSSWPRQTTYTPRSFVSSKRQCLQRKSGRSPSYSVSATRQSTACTRGSRSVGWADSTRGGSGCIRARTWRRCSGLGQVTSGRSASSNDGRCGSRGDRMNCPSPSANHTRTRFSSGQTSRRSRLSCGMMSPGS